jgi:hypothetical protein
MSLRRVFGFALVVIGCVSLVYADQIVKTLQGTCRISASATDNQLEIRLERASCNEARDCHEQTMTGPASAWTGFAPADLSRNGSHVDAVMRAEAGTLTCSGTVREQVLVGDYSFSPNDAFVARMGQLGITGFDARKLQAYALFRVDSSWTESLQKAGISGIDANNLLAMKIFKVEPAYVEDLKKLGYATPTAQKLIALRVHKVEPEEIRRVRSLGYDPTLDELVQMRIFKVTPEFIERMRARGLNNLTISKLVQIRIFKLDE